VEVEGVLMAVEVGWRKIMVCKVKDGGFDESEATGKVLDGAWRASAGRV
jgi:hypothetical protein